MFIGSTNRLTNFDWAFIFYSRQKTFLNSDFALFYPLHKEAFYSNSNCSFYLIPLTIINQSINQSTGCTPWISEDKTHPDFSRKCLQIAWQSQENVSYVGTWSQYCGGEYIRAAGYAPVARAKTSGDGSTKLPGRRKGPVPLCASISCNWYNSESAGNTWTRRRGTWTSCKRKKTSRKFLKKRARENKDGRSRSSASQSSFSARICVPDWCCCCTLPRISGRGVSAFWGVARAAGARWRWRRPGSRCCCWYQPPPLAWCYPHPPSFPLGWTLNKPLAQFPVIWTALRRHPWMEIPRREDREKTKMLWAMLQDKSNQSIYQSNEKA